MSFATTALSFVGLLVFGLALWLMIDVLEGSFFTNPGPYLGVIVGTIVIFLILMNVIDRLDNPHGASGKFTEI